MLTQQAYAQFTAKMAGYGNNNNVEGERLVPLEWTKPQYRPRIRDSLSVNQFQSTIVRSNLFPTHLWALWLDRGDHDKLSGATTSHILYPGYDGVNERQKVMKRLGSNPGPLAHNISTLTITLSGCWCNMAKVKSVDTCHGITQFFKFLGSRKLLKLLP
jgi:hypothetical protein